MTSILYKQLEKCVQSFEEEVQKSFNDFTQSDTFNETVVAQENSRDYHYEEIFDHLKQIKEHINVIADHCKSLHALENKVNGPKIDKNYIKRQVETFQKIGNVNRRQQKMIRPRETSSLKLLACWEKMLEEQESKGEVFPPVRKRANSLRKNKKIVSSTVDTFLEHSSRKCMSLESLLEDRSFPEAINEEVCLEGRKKEEEKPETIVEEEVDTKPRIVEVIYKKKR